MELMCPSLIQTRAGNSLNMVWLSIEIRKYDEVGKASLKGLLIVIDAFEGSAFCIVYLASHAHLDEPNVQRTRRARL